MDAIESLSEQFPDKQAHRIAALRLIRVYPGMWLEQVDSSSKQTPLAKQRAEYNTHAVDMLITLLQHLTSFWYAVDPQCQLTDAERAFLKATNLDLGWVAPSN